MDQLQDDNFLGGVFTFFMEDIDCPHCGVVITREEIDTHLKTYKGEDTGSHMKASWEY